jgi:nucleoside-diphosphate-sugar epimerase
VSSSPARLLPSVRPLTETSIAANRTTVDPSKPVPTVYTEEDWNETSPAVSAKEGNNQAPPEAYRASKTLAERAAWEFVETHKPGWDVATINPPLVFGPIIHQVGSSSS